jgi:ABC-type transport system substrate-binding protein
MGKNYDLRPLLHSDYGNPIAYDDPAVAALLDAFASAESPEERKGIFENLHARLIEEIPYYCLFYKTYYAVASPALDGLMSPHFDNIYSGCESWQCIYSAVLAE